MCSLSRTVAQKHLPIGQGVKCLAKKTEGGPITPLPVEGLRWSQTLTLSGFLSTGERTFSAASIIPSAMLATFSAWLSHGLGSPPTTMYASPIVSTCGRQNTDVSEETMYTYKHWKTSFEKNCFSAWARTLNMGLISKG